MCEERKKQETKCYVQDVLELKQERISMLKIVDNKFLELKDFLNNIKVKKKC